jgi:hypothetical protein
MVFLSSFNGAQYAQEDKMAKKLWILFFAALVGTGAMVACDDGNDDDNNNPVTDAGGDADADADGDVDGDTTDDGAPKGEGWPCTQANAANPQFRVAAMDVVAPQTLTVAKGLLVDALDQFRFVWLVDIDTEAMTMTTGAGQALDEQPAMDDEEFCKAKWAVEENLAATTVGIEENNGILSTTSPIELINIPVYDENEPGLILLTLPVRQMQITGMAVAEDGATIGTYADGEWTDSANISGYISFTDAAGIEVAGMGITVCQLLCGGADALSNCAENKPADCQNPPEAIPGGTEGAQGYQLVGTIAAGATTISE